MQFPIIKKKDQSLALEVPDNLLQQLTSKLSPPAEAQLKESQGKVAEAEAQLKESQEKVAGLEEKVTAAEGKTMSDFAPMEKASFVIAWAKDLSMEDKAIFCEGVGIPIAKVTEAEVAEAAAKAAAEAEPNVIEGKTDRPGYKYLPHLNMSVKE